MGKPYFSEGQAEKKSQNWNERSFFKGNHGQLLQFCPGRIEAPLLHILDPNSPSFYLKCPRKCKKTPIILAFFQYFPKFGPLPLLHFGVGPKFDHISLCAYISKLDYAKFGASNLLLSKVIEEKPLGVGPIPPPPLLVKEGLSQFRQRPQPFFS